MDDELQEKIWNWCSLNILHANIKNSFTSYFAKIISVIVGDIFLQEIIRMVEICF